MLVVTRKLDEAIVIADNIRVTVLNIERGKIKLGIEAPKEISIKRAELISPSPVKDCSGKPIPASDLEADSSE